MDREYVLGIDMGGTNTDAALLECDGSFAGGADAALPMRPVSMRLVAACKTPTQHEDLPASACAAIHLLAAELGRRGLSVEAVFSRVRRVTLGTTLAVNALVQNRADRVGLVLSGGPGMDPRRAALGDDVCLVPGGLDHRGAEVSPLDMSALPEQVRAWRHNGVRAVACVGKFSPRNPAHELAMAAAVSKADAAMPITVGHTLSGALNFPRRVATAFFNAAVARLYNEFLDAIEAALASVGIDAPVFLIKADGGGAPIRLARKEPVQSILSGPAASVMGILALCPQDVLGDGCSLLLDMGGTTTDIALVLHGSPVVDRDGMLLRGRRTLVRALAAISIGVGGDSQLQVVADGVHVGPLRQGAAMAFGGDEPTFLDALNTCRQHEGAATSGDVAASVRGIAALAARHDMLPHDLASMAVDAALDQVAVAAQALVDQVNERPIYTLAALKAVREACPLRAWLVGGPAELALDGLADRLGIPVEIPPLAHVANAVGAALTRPAASLELYADTARRTLHVPALDLTEGIDRDFTPTAARQRACELLTQRLTDAGCAAQVEVTSTEVFATLDAGDRSSKDIRVVCQAVPGIEGYALPDTSD